MKYIKIRKRLIALCLSAVLLSGCGADYVTIGSLENCSSAGASMTYRKFDGVKEYQLETSENARDIQVDVETESGSLDAYIVKDGGEKSDAVYEGEDIPSSSFTVTVPEAGTYRIHLRAENHKGSYSFQVSEGAEESLLPDALPLEFVFASGAGAWGTALTLHRDGSFEGAFHDSEMGDTGDGYPQGTVYLSEFTGRFDGIHLVNDHTWELTLAEVTAEQEEGTEWIEGGIRYAVQPPYGLDSGREFLLYAPETPVSELSEEFLSWWPFRSSAEEGALETLSCYGLYNQEPGYGFFACE